MAAWRRDELGKIAERDDLHIAPLRDDAKTFKRRSVEFRNHQRRNLHSSELKYSSGTLLSFRQVGQTELNYGPSAT